MGHPVSGVLAPEGVSRGCDRLDQRTPHHHLEEVVLYLITGGWVVLSFLLAPVVGRLLKTAGQAAHDATCPCMLWDGAE
jgi:hypothetical protein